MSLIFVWYVMCKIRTLQIMSKIRDFLIAILILSRAWSLRRVWIFPLQSIGLFETDMILQVIANKTFEHETCSISTNKPLWNITRHETSRILDLLDDMKVDYKVLGILEVSYTFVYVVVSQWRISQVGSPFSTRIR